MSSPYVLFASVILLLPMGYFLLQAPAFLLVRLPWMAGSASPSASD